MSRRLRRWGWLMAVFALSANSLLFFILSRMNKLPRKTSPHRQFSAIEVFPVELPPPPLLPMAQAIPTVAKTSATQTKMKTTELVYEPTDFTPRMVDWLPELPLVQVPMTLRTIEVPSPPQAPQQQSAAQPTGPMQLFQVDQVPKKISGRLPSYPYWAQAQSREGFVVLRFVVDSSGNVGKIEIDQVVGDTRFTEAAKETVAKWIFSPAMLNGKPVAVWCRQRIQFELY